MENQTKLKKVAIILINYKDYAEKYLLDCFASLTKQDYQGEMKIFIVDNETSEKSYNFIKETVGEKAEIIRNNNNDGFSKGNNDAIKIAISHGFDYIILFNMDTIIEKDCVSKMVVAAEEEKEVGAIQARLMLWPEKEKINSLGNATHFLGFGYCIGYNESLTKHKEILSKQFGDIAFPSGAAVLFKAEVLKKVGLFDEELWMYNEDQDLGWRIWLAGYRCVINQEAVVYHKFEFSRSAQKVYWMDRNRIIVALKNYHLASILLIFPAFVIMELGLLAYSFSVGWIDKKIELYKYFLKPKNWSYILKARRESQKLRKVKDRDILKLFSGRISYQEIAGTNLRLANAVFSIYWSIIKKIIIW